MMQDEQEKMMNMIIIEKMNMNMMYDDDNLIVTSRAEFIIDSLSS